MKKTNFLISLLAVVALTGCSGGGNGGGGGGNTSENSIVIEDYGTVKFEAEDFDVSDWYSDESYDGEIIIESSAASGGNYLAAADKAGADARFSFELKKDSRVVISAAYAQMESDLNIAIDMSKVYTYNIKTVSPLAFEAGKSTLSARSSATNWELMPYIFQDLYAGTYEVTLSVLDNAPACPSIDYIQFKTSDPSVVPVDPSKITEDDIPDNDFRNLQQYKYLMDEG